MKKCNKCGQVKPLTEFYPKKDKFHKNNPYSSGCKVCERKRVSDNWKKKTDEQKRN